MKKTFIGASLLLVLFMSGDSHSFGPGGGGMRGPAGGARPAMPARTPSFSPAGGARPMPAAPAGPRPGLVPQNRPNIAADGFNRPGGGGAPIVNRPAGPQIVNRPGGGTNIVNRPTGPQIINRPGGGINIGDRTGRVNIGNQPDININRSANVIAGNRTAINSGNRAGFVNRQNVAIGNRAGFVNQPGIVNPFNRPGVVNRPFYPPYYNVHAGWYHGAWRPWYSRPATWVAGAATAGWLLSPGISYAYSNPFCAPSATVVAPALDYSQPIPVPVVQQEAAYGDVTTPATPVIVNGTTVVQPPAEPQPPPTPDNVSPEAVKQFDSARAAFKQGDYTQALDLVNKAIGEMPGDPVLHEFRALVLFAQKKYRDAAAADYAVLSAGPGWDWETMKSLYPSEKVYTEQLRALEAYQRANPKEADAHFLLAYHYLVLDYPDQAAKQLEEVLKLLPNDQLTAQILKALKQPPGERPNPGG